MKSHVLALSVLLSGVTLYGATRPIDDFSTDRETTQEEFAAAQNAVGNGGIIEFKKEKWYIIKKGLKLIKSNITLVGSGRTSSYITYVGGGKLNAMFTTDKDGFTIQQLTIQGKSYPTFDSEKPLDLYEGARCETGVEAGIRVNNGALNVKAVGARFQKVNVGIEYQTSTFPDGLEVTDTQFTTGRGMINAHDGKRTGANLNYEFNRAMKIDNADFFYKLGQGARGITLDFGNGKTTSIVNFKGSITNETSYIQNSYINNTTNFNIDANHLKSLKIYNNDLMGGGAGNLRKSFCNALHFEDECTDILIQKNRIYQRKTNNVGHVLGNTSHVWAGGNHGLPKLSVIGNTMTGTANVGSLSGSINDWKVTWNKFNLDELPGYIINGWKDSTTINHNNNKVNGVALRESQIQLK